MTIMQIPHATDLEPILTKFDRPTLEALITAAIDVLDARDGDVDIELNGDENDDPGDLVDYAYPEWHTLDATKRAIPFAPHCWTQGVNGGLALAALLEDTEADDDDRCEARHSGVFHRPPVVAPVIRAADENRTVP